MKTLTKTSAREVKTENKIIPFKVICSICQSEKPYFHKVEFKTGKTLYFCSECF